MDVTGVIAFSKDPRQGQGKSRLRLKLGEEITNQICFGLFDITAKALLLSQSDSLQGLWAADEPQESLRRTWSTLPTLPQGAGDLGEKIARIEEKMSLLFSRWIIIGSDLPFMTEGILLRADDLLRRSDFVIGPSIDGGFYLFGAGKPLGAQFWRSLEYSSSETGNQLRAALKGTVGTMEPLRDLDLPEDIAPIVQEMSILEHLNQEQKKFLSLLDSQLPTSTSARCTSASTDESMPSSFETET